MENHHCTEKSGKQCLLRLGKYEQVDILSYSTLHLSASKELCGCRRRTGAAACACSAPAEAVGLSAQPTSLPRASGEPEPGLLVA